MTFAIIVLALLRFAYRWYYQRQTFISCTSDQQLVQIKEDYLRPWEYNELKECLLNHPKLYVESALSGNAFSKTRGFVVKFNNDATFLNHPDYACFGELFQKMQLPQTNAYVFNALLCEVSEYDDWKNNRTAVGLHLDQTVGMKEEWHDWLAHQVNVLYMDIAEDMVGGELELWRYGKGDLKKLDLKSPHARVTPKENTMVAFRGDSFHQVRAFRTNTRKRRLSLVLEQYKINEKHYDNTIEWTEESKSNMMEL